MAYTGSVTVQNYNGSVLSAGLLSGSATNLVLSSLGEACSTTFTDNNNSLDVGEVIELGDGRTATVLGSGTVQPGVSVLGVIVGLGTIKDVVIVETNDGDTVFIYPDGGPNTLSSIALILDASPVDYLGPGGIICFAEGTMILTEKGEVSVESLQAGDLIVTRDNGLEPLCWIGSKSLVSIDFEMHPELRPIRIGAGALGVDTPTSDLMVSPQHRVLVRSKIVKRMFDAEEVLVSAKQLLQVEGINVAEDLDKVTYYHFSFLQHQVVTSNGAQTESLYIGPEALKSVGRKSREELFAIFPQLEDHDYMTPSARILASGRMGRRLAVRHLQNNKSFIS